MLVEKAEGGELADHVAADETGGERSTWGGVVAGLQCVADDRHCCEREIGGGLSEADEEKPVVDEGIGGGAGKVREDDCKELDAALGGG